MSQTMIGLNDPIAVKRYSATLFTDMAKDSYWGRKFMSKSPDAPLPVQVLTELEHDSGDTVNFALFAQLRQKPVYDDDIRKGKEEALRNFNDKVQIGQVWCGVNAGGRMSRKRTLHDLRVIAKQKMQEWWARWVDEVNFVYASGSRGTNTSFIQDVGYPGFAGNPLQAPDSDHVLFGGDATSFGSISNDDDMSLGLIDRSVTKAQTMGGGSDGKVKIRPIRINGENHHVIVMHPFQEHALRTAAVTATNNWMDIQKAAAAAEGKKNPIFTGALGMYRNVVLHSHESVITFRNAGSGALPAARALFLGAQAMVMAFGSPGSNMRFDWNEEKDDRGNQIVIGSSTVLGMKKTRFNERDFGVFALDTYAKDPNS